MRPAKILIASCIALSLAAGAYFFMDRHVFHEKHRQVILVTLDTTRADHFGCYGDKGMKTPNMDALAGESVLFENCITTSCYTNPSHTSIFTSLYIKDHRVTDNFTKLTKYPDIMSSVFKAAGYKTAAFTSASLLSYRAGLDQGFDDFFGCEPPPGAVVNTKSANTAQRSAAETNVHVLKWLEENKDNDFFVWIHYFDPHMPYSPPAPYDKMYNRTSTEDIDNLHIEHRPAFAGYFNRSKDPEYYRNLYKGAVSYMDGQMGRVFQKMKDLDIYGDSIIVVVADHGEALGENNQYFLHADIMYDSVAMVPLIIKLPGQVITGRRKQMVSTVDIYPTVLEMSDIPVKRRIRGKSLTAVIKGSGPSEAREETYTQGQWQANGALRTKDYTYVWVLDKYTGGLAKRDMRPQELYAAGKAMGQKDNIINSRPEVAAQLKRKAAAFLNDVIPMGYTTAITDEEYLRKLKSLGYAR